MVVFATGTVQLPNRPEVLDDGRPRVSGARTARRGLYVCSYIVSPNGQLRQIGIEAEAIAADAARLAA